MRSVLLTKYIVLMCDSDVMYIHTKQTNFWNGFGSCLIAIVRYNYNTAKFGCSVEWSGITTFIYLQERERNMESLIDDVDSLITPDLSADAPDWCANCKSLRQVSI